MAPTSVATEAHGAGADLCLCELLDGGVPEGALDHERIARGGENWDVHDGTPRIPAAYRRGRTFASP
jgi:hypothetical protein